LNAGGAGTSTGAGGAIGGADGGPDGSPGVDASPPDGGSVPPVPTREFYWSIALAESVMKKWPTNFDAAYYRAWSYVNGYMLFGFNLLYEYTGDTKYRDYMKTYIDKFVGANGSFTRGWGGGALDDILTGTTLVQLYEITKDERYHTAANTVRRAFNNYPRLSDGGFPHNGGSERYHMWIDGIFMGGLFNQRYGKTFNDAAALDEAAKQIVIYASHGERGTTGLFVHGWDERKDAPWADKTTGQSSEVWSEGLGWYALAVVETLAALPQNHPNYAKVKDILVRMIAALKDTQDPKTGRWFDVVDKGNLPDNWTDSSGTAMFVYTIRRAVELGFVPADPYAAIAERGYQGLINPTFAKVVNGMVEVYSACDGVNIQNNYAAYIRYNRVTNAKEGYAGFLWATAIMEKPPKKN